MELERKLKRLQIREKQLKPKVNLLDLPTEVLYIVASFLFRKHLKNFGLTNKKCQQIFQSIDHRIFDVRRCFKLNENKILDKAKSRNYISLNLNGCYWLGIETVLKLVSKERVRELDLIDSDWPPIVIEAVAKLSLTRLSFSLTENWRNFFVSNELNSISCFKNLKKLQIDAVFLLTFVPRYVLQHCPNLEYLKLFTYVKSERIETQSFQVLNIPTPVPKLESLILDFHPHYITRQDLNSVRNTFTEIDNFLHIILHKKAIPLKRIDLGQYTSEAILKGILRGKNITFESTRNCCLSSISDQDDNNNFTKLSHVLKADECESMVNSMLKSPFCRAISIENINLNKSYKLRKIIVNSGNTSLEEINFKKCVINENVYGLIKNICDINSRITCLDMSVTAGEWYTKINACLINSFAELKNLRTLRLSTLLLTTKPDRKYHLNQDKMLLQLSLWKMAKQCKSLQHFGIVGFESETAIRQEVLLCLRYFKNLRELYLVNFRISGSKPALPAITKSCAQLKHLYIAHVYNIKPHLDYQCLEQSLAHTKQLKHLSLNQAFRMTKQFVDNLTECNKIEKLCVEPIANETRNNKYFARNLKKLLKLEVFITSGEPEVLSVFESAIDKHRTKDRKPLFYGHNEEHLERHLPSAHYHMLQYDSLESV